MLRHAVGRDEPERVVGRGATHHGPGRVAELCEPGGSSNDGAAAGRVVHDQRQGARRVARHASERSRGPRRREHDGDDEQSAQQQEQQVLELQSPLMLLGRRDEVPHRRKDDGRWLTAGQEMEEDGDGGGGEPHQHPGVKKADHPERASGARA